MSAGDAFPLIIYFYEAYRDTRQMTTLILIEDNIFWAFEISKLLKWFVLLPIHEAMNRRIGVGKVGILPIPIPFSDCTEASRKNTEAYNGYKEKNDRLT